jgi:hypothetical protein
MMRRAILVTAVLVVMIFASVPAPSASVAAPAVPSSVHATAAGSIRASTVPGPTPGPSASPASSGPGTFFTTSSVPAVPAGQQSCFGGTCVVAADDPSLNLTSQGDLVAAYTAWSVEAPCASARPYALTEIGIVVSTNSGSTWSTPSYLGNPVCSSPSVSEYPSAWEPSLTSLSNGTLVLTYIEYNVSASGGFPPRLSFVATSPSVTYDRLVVSRSYDAGAHWTVPLVLNTSADPALTPTSFAPVRPVVTATGTTVYLAWMNLSDQLNGFGTGSSGIHVVASTDGGQSFGAPTNLTTLVGSPGTSVAMNPSIAVDPSGRLYVAYATNLSYLAVLGCPSSGCYYGGWSASVEVATSVNNGTSFAYTPIAGTALVPLSRWGPFFDPSPVLAVGPGGGQVYVAYSSGYLQPLCSIYGCYTGLGATLSVANSSTNGATFSSPHPVDPYLLGGTVDGANLLYNPAIGVTSDGVLQMTATYDNFSICAAGAAGTFCGPQAEIYVNSTDNGATFSPAIYVGDNSTQLYLNPNNPDGEYATLVTAGSSVWLAWTSDICPAWITAAAFSACPWPGTGGASGVQISELFHGAGLTLTFSETGLPAGTTWTTDVLGNVREGSAPTNLVITGVPAGLNLTWNLSAEAQYGYRYTASTSIASPSVLTSSTTVSVSYATQVLLQLSAVPFLPPYPYGGVPGCGGGGFYWNLTACPDINWNVTPAPGPDWVAVGSVVPLSVTPNDVLYCNQAYPCYSTNILNLSFLSWKGTGSSASNTTSHFTNVTVNAPVNETASFTFNGWCYYEWVSAYNPAYYACLGPNDTYGFHETGLPSGTNWGVTISGGTQTQTNESTTDWNIFQSTLNASLLNYTVWTVPDGHTGNLWVPAATPVSPIVPEVDPVVQVNFTLEAPSAATFPIVVNALNLPAATSWSYSIDSTQYGSSTPSAPAVDVLGGTHTIGASDVVLSNSTRYVPATIDTLDLSGTGIRSNFSTPSASLSIQGATYADVNYSVQYWLQATATSCGNVSASSGWYSSGTSVDLTATPGAGCEFVGWSGRGAGSVSSTNTVIGPYVAGPITELAVFEPLPPATWTVTVTEVGLGAHTTFSVGLDGRLYSSTTQISVPGLATGIYTLSLPYAYENGSDGTRYLPTLSSTNLTAVAGGYLIDTDGSIVLSYATQYLVNSSASAGGTVSPAGAGWYDAGSQVTLAATPADGQVFVGWAGAGLGAFSTLSSSFGLLVTGPASEVASFAPAPAPPTETFGLTVTESGLVSGTSWSAEIGTAGVASVTSTVTATLPNGTYEVGLPIISGATGVRYVPDPSFTNVTISGSGGSASVVYSPEFYLTLTASSGGSISPSPGWFANGTVVSLTATPSNASELFVNWTGAVVSTSSTVSVTVDGPISESAGFQPVAHSTPPTTGSNPSSTNGLLVSVGLLVGLLVLGTILGLLLLRRRPPAPPTAADEPEAPTPDGEALYGQGPPAPDQ